MTRRLDEAPLRARVPMGASYCSFCVCCSGCWSGVRGPESTPLELVGDPLLKQRVDPAVMHGSVDQFEIAAVLADVADQRQVSVGSVSDEFGYQPKLKADYRDEVRAYGDVD